MAKPKAKKITLTRIRATARRTWQDNGILIAGHTDCRGVAGDLLRTIAPALKTKGLNLYIKDEAGPTRPGVDNQVSYIITDSRPRPAPKKWDKYVALADIINPEPPFDTDPEVWTAAVQQELAQLNDVPQDLRDLVHDAIHGRPKETENHTSGDHTDEPGFMNPGDTPPSETNACQETPDLGLELIAPSPQEVGPGPAPTPQPPEPEPALGDQEPQAPAQEPPTAPGPEPTPDPTPDPVA